MPGWLPPPAFHRFPDPLPILWLPRLRCLPALFERCAPWLPECRDQWLRSGWSPVEPRESPELRLGSWAARPVYPCLPEGYYTVLPDLKFLVHLPGRNSCKSPVCWLLKSFQDSCGADVPPSAPR